MNDGRWMKKMMLAGALAAVAGCAPTVNTVERETPVGQKQLIRDRRVITDSDLNDDVGVAGVNSSVVSGDLLQMQVEIVNKSDELQHFNYRVEWFDENGMMVSTPTSVWIPRQVEGKESVFLKAVAPSPKAKDFKVKLMKNVRDSARSY